MADTGVDSKKNDDTQNQSSNINTVDPEENDDGGFQTNTEAHVPASAKVTSKTNAQSSNVVRNRNPGNSEQANTEAASLQQQLEGKEKEEQESN